MESAHDLYLAMGGDAPHFHWERTDAATAAFYRRLLTALLNPLGSARPSLVTQAAEYAHTQAVYATPEARTGLASFLREHRGAFTDGVGASLARELEAFLGSEPGSCPSRSALRAIDKGLFRLRKLQVDTAASRHYAAVTNAQRAFTQLKRDHRSVTLQPWLRAKLRGEPEEGSKRPREEARPSGPSAPGSGKGGQGGKDGFEVDPHLKVQAYAALDGIPALLLTAKDKLDAAQQRYEAECPIFRAAEALGAVTSAAGSAAAPVPRSPDDPIPPAASRAQPAPTTRQEQLRQLVLEAERYRGSFSSTGADFEAVLTAADRRSGGMHCRTQLLQRCQAAAVAAGRDAAWLQWDAAALEQWASRCALAAGPAAALTASVAALFAEAKVSGAPVAAVLGSVTVAGAGATTRVTSELDVVVLDLTTGQALVVVEAKRSPCDLIYAKDQRDRFTRALLGAPADPPPGRGRGRAQAQVRSPTAPAAPGVVFTGAVVVDPGWAQVLATRFQQPEDLQGRLGALAVQSWTTAAFAEYLADVQGRWVFATTLPPLPTDIPLHAPTIHIACRELAPAMVGAGFKARIGGSPHEPAVVRYRALVALPERSPAEAEEMARLDAAFAAEVDALFAADIALAPCTAVLQEAFARRAQDTPAAFVEDIQAVQCRNTLWVSPSLTV